ncbi:glutathione binding-like protein [Luteimonas pelagia]
MKLYTKPGACSTADHIALEWTGAPYDVEVLDAAAMRADAYRAINPAGAVPAIVDEAADGGRFVLTQNAAILGYIADLHPGARLAGDGSPRQRAEANRWLAFVNSDVHPAFKPIFGPSAFHPDEAERDAVKDAARKRLRGLFETADRQLAGREWIAGFRSYADPYLYVVTRWAKKAGVDLSGLDNLEAFFQRMQADAGVLSALETEGLQTL